MSALTKVNARAIMILQKEFAKPFASKALSESRKDTPETLGTIGSKAQLSSTATDNSSIHPYLEMDDCNGSSMFAFVASKKLLVEESLRRSTDMLQVGNLLIQKPRKAPAKPFVSFLHEDL